MPRRSATWRARSSVLAQSASTRQRSSDRNAGTWTCWPKPAPMMPTAIVSLMVDQRAWAVGNAAADNRKQECRGVQCALEVALGQQFRQRAVVDDRRHAGLELDPVFREWRRAGGEEA